MWLNFNQPFVPEAQNLLSNLDFWFFLFPVHPFKLFKVTNMTQTGLNAVIKMEIQLSNALWYVESRIKNKKKVLISVIFSK